MRNRLCLKVPLRIVLSSLNSKRKFRVLRYAIMVQDARIDGTYRLLKSHRDRHCIADGT